MNIFITGASGFIGTHLTRMLLDHGHDITCVGRSEPHIGDHPKCRFIVADPTRPGAWQEALKDMDAVFNLAGAPIFKRWDEAYKKQLFDSRVLTTRNVVEALPQNKSAVLISTSAVGYYGQRHDDILMEDEPPGRDFLAILCSEWERAAYEAKAKGVRTVTTRFGVVLGNDGGALMTMVPLFRRFLGGPMGKGNHWFPWIHIEDLCSALYFILQTPEIKGPVNMTAPIPIRQRAFARALGRQLKRPAFMPAPAFAVRLAMGELGRYMMYSQKVIPDKLIKHGYKFKFMEIQPALEDLLA
ncbi:MAG: TIGR01777 family oxidoreductase [Desulfobacterales bacterium]